MNNYTNKFGNIVSIIGCQWGDEGKGKLIDILSEEYELIVRSTGGANAGHTIYVKNPESGELKKYIFHLIPSGMLHEKATCLIGNGVVIHLQSLLNEMKVLQDGGVKIDGRLLISDRAHLLFDYHKIIDGLEEDQKGDNKVGTTKRGIGPCYTNKIRRSGIRVHDLVDWDNFVKKYHNNLQALKDMYGDFEYDADHELELHKDAIEKIKSSIVNSAYYLNRAVNKGTKILLEGANATMLDVDHGTYPYVTSSNPTVGGMISGCGIPANKINGNIGILKAYTTRVGEGPFPTELTDQLGESIREQGGEYGSTTGRPRRCGWMDTVVGKYSVILNGLTSVNLTKLDVLRGIDTLKIATHYTYKGERVDEFPADINILEKVEPQYIEMKGWHEDISEARSFDDLPENARKYVEKIEELIGCRIETIGVGVSRDQLIIR